MRLENQLFLLADFCIFVLETILAINMANVFTSWARRIVEMLKFAPHDLFNIAASFSNLRKSSYKRNIDNVGDI